MTLAARIETLAKRPFLLAANTDSPLELRLVANRLFPSSRERLRIRLYSLLLLTDITLIALAFLGAGAIRLGSPFEGQSLRTVLVVIPTFLAIAAQNRAYSIKALQRPAYGAGKVAEALGYGIAVAIGLLFYTKASVEFSRQIFAIGTLLAALLAVAGRLVVGARVRSKCGGKFVNRLIIQDGVELPGTAHEVVVSAADLGLSPGDDDPVLLDRFSRALENCDAVVIACSEGRRASWSHALKSAAVNVEILTPELDGLQAIALGDFNGQRTLVVSARPLNVRDRTLKRTLDLAVVLSALILFAPLMIAISIAIMLESGRPILFRQERVGRSNRLFQLLKFRSFDHRCADPLGERSAGRTDERITKVGKFIRRTSLDELPQLFNVIRGEMSIVGPRPHALGSTAEQALFWKIDSRYFHRHTVKPGMTGLAQVRGYRGATLRRHDLTNRLQSDLEYLSQWTIWRDLKIIVATFAVVLHPNAF